MIEYEYFHESPAGMVRIKKKPDGLWAAYLDDREWKCDFTLPDYAIGWLTMFETPFPEGVAFIGNSMNLGLADNIKNWGKRRVN